MNQQEFIPIVQKNGELVNHWSDDFEGNASEELVYRHDSAEYHIYYTESYMDGAQAYFIERDGVQIHADESIPDHWLTSPNKSPEPECTCDQPDQDCRCGSCYRCQWHEQAAYNVHRLFFGG